MKITNSEVNLQQELDELDRSEHHHKRGTLFEQFAAHLLEEHDFEVSLNPKAAPSRQTDLCAQSDGLFFIIEAKWRNKLLHVGDISPVYERLRTMTSDVFACVFSMSGYAKTVEKYIAKDRSREVLLFDEREIRGIAAGDLSFNELLHRKREEIRKNAKVWFETWKPERLHVRPRWRKPEILSIANHSKDWWLSRTQGDDVMFAREILDLGSYSDSAVSLRLRAEVTTPGELLGFLRILTNQLRLAGVDSFSIHQRTAGWYGSGMQNFVEAAKQWEERYEELNWPNYHHSEGLAYFDHLEHGGLLGLTLHQRIGEHAKLYSCFVEIFLSGIPIDMTSILRLCKRTGNEERRFEIDHKRIQTHRFYPPVKIKPIGTIIDQTEGEYVCGLIAKNPFYKQGTRSSFEVKPLDSSNPIKFLSNTELLFCRLKDWHPVGKLMDHYRLLYVEGCWIENFPVLYVACDWL